MKIINIYTDGACSGNQYNKNVGGWGAVIEYKGICKEIYGGEVNTTNNRMELMALIQALEALTAKDLKLNIYSDSAYVISCLCQKWYCKWRANNWYNPKKEIIKNRDLWERLLDSVEAFKNISFYIVKGHLNLKKTPNTLKHYKIFNAKNKLSFAYTEFIEVVKMNHLADSLANYGMLDIKEKGGNI